ncbi:uncharacterized protein BDR25DRAFT_310039 [Lindgomyces ingoldianus]|uniref:Uncharacterized protein n=1 Tax=Lindgomyces ingoldianus TaxID=673940 RepID=A0ACB6RC26_9PLEO|nr:uncharacterized protein BDR25DRAFT_310039 [Lindgomyces ingoldianus]KAF2476696.1 hypothetical protein BDR25DRAFT_310039 [Lindgomyces ingoldianus]
MYFAKKILALFPVLAYQNGRGNAYSPCPSQSDIPIGFVQTYSAYACRGDLQTFPNVTSGICVDAKNFTTVRGYRKGNTPEGVECTFDFYAAPGCKGFSVSAGRETDGSNNWIECVRSFVDVKGEVVSSGASFMYSCYSRR